MTGVGFVFLTNPVMWCCVPRKRCGQDLTISIKDRQVTFRVVTTADRADEVAIEVPVPSEVPALTALTEASLEALTMPASSSRS